ncbi:MAG: hypothetical protein IKV16_01305 [Clostridia bacterium]|nr:hypothetical protein [Clostridia bacterium]
MIIENYGTGERCKETLRRLLLAEADGALPPEINRCILLPIPTSRDSIHLSGTEKLLDAIFSDVKSGDFVAGYGIDSERTRALTERGAVVYDASLDEKFLTENAEVTAIGALGYVLTTTDKIPKDIKFTIVGYGRIGAALLRMLLFHNAKVTVASGREKTCIDLGKCGIDAIYMPRGSALPKTDADIIINTAPTDLSASFSGDSVPDGVRVIELASGNNFKGISGVERLPSIPDRSYGKTAAGIYFSAIMRAIREAYK